MLDASETPADVVAERVRRLRDGSDGDGPGRLVPLPTLLDDAVDLTPARHLRGSADLRLGFDRARTRFRDGLAAVTAPAPGLLAIRPGDVAAAQAGRRTHPRVIDADGPVAGPRTQAFRLDTSRCDPHFLACLLHAAGTARASPASSRADLRRTPIPWPPIDEQRAYGSAYHRLVQLSAALRDLADTGDDTITLAIRGLADGGLHPDDRTTT